jgi:hypothetical protein
MLFKMLKLAGLDVPAQIAVARTEIELRAKEAAAYAKQATVTATLVAAFAAFAAFLFVVAAGVGLFALYSVIAEHFGVYAGLGTVAGLLIAAASVLLFAAIAKAKALSNLRIVRQPSLVRSPPTPPTPAVGAFGTTESSADLFEPLAFAFAKYVRFPTFRNPVLDQFVGGLKVSAQGTADDALHRASNLIRYGSRSQLLAMIGGAAALGWLLARQHSSTLHI